LENANKKFVEFKKIVYNEYVYMLLRLKNGGNHGKNEKL
jgi:hypothetical protein